MSEYKLYQGDCLEVMPTLASGSVDMILTDLPYGTTACSWDSVIPFEPLWENYKRLIKPRGAIVLFGSQPFTSALVMSNLAWFKYCWVWEKSQGGNFAVTRYMPLSVSEDILVFGKESVNYYPQMDKREKPRMIGGRHSNDCGRGFGGIQNITKLSTESHPRNVLHFPVVVRTESVHESQKPIALLAYLIRTYTNPGETILDNTMGSGSTIVAAIQEGRHGIGIEQDSSYFAIAQDRCANTSAQPLLFPIESFQPVYEPSGFAFDEAVA